MKTNVRKYTDDELINYVEKLPSFKGWRKGIYSFILRSAEDGFNIFDDKMYTFIAEGNDKKPKCVMVCTGTSNAGRVGLMNFSDYNTLGCAVLLTDILVYDSHKVGKHKGKYTAYVQNVGFPYTRDNDKDEKAENYGKVYINIIGANYHHAGDNSQFIEGWSTACLVRNVKKQWIKWMNYLKGQGYPTISTVIIPEF